MPTYVEKELPFSNLNKDNYIIDIDNNDGLVLMYLTPFIFQGQTSQMILRPFPLLGLPVECLLNHSLFLCQ